MTYADFSEDSYAQLEAINEDLVKQLAEGGANMQTVQFMAIQIRLAALVEELTEANAIHPARFELRYETHLNAALGTLLAQAKPVSRLIVPK